MIVVLVIEAFFKMVNLFAEGKVFVMISIILVVLIDNGKVIIAGPGMVEISGFNKGSKLLSIKGMVFTLIVIFVGLFQFITNGFMSHKALAIF